ncbi:MAG: hypothetical protein ACKO2G_06415 [Verrucomicrobiales bacterium]
MQSILPITRKENLQMKTQAIAIFLLLMFCSLQSAFGYSAIWNIDGWDRARLKEAGITITTWKHDQIGEDPALNWLEITFDASKVGKDQNVIMTLHVLTDNHQTVSAHRVERKPGDGDKMKILFAVGNENIKKSELKILVPKLLSEGLKREFGNPGFGGYTLSLSRIMELAAEDSKKTPSTNQRDAEPTGTGQPTPPPCVEAGGQ